MIIVKIWLQLETKYGWIHATVSTKNFHNLIVFSTYMSFMHHGGNLENNFHSNFVIDDGLCPNWIVCCEINAHMNDIILQQNITLICKALSHFCNPKLKLKSTTFNDKIFMKIYTYIKKNHKEKSLPSKFSIFLKVAKFK